jgi:hypothetical protein
MSNEDKTLQLLVALNRLTSTGQIKWEVAEPPSRIVRGTDVVIPLCFRAAYGKANYALYQQRTRLYDGEHDSFYWTESNVLAILDDDDRVLLEIAKQYAALDDLLSTVRAKVVSLDDLLKDLGIGGDTP